MSKQLFITIRRQVAKAKMKEAINSLLTHATAEKSPEYSEVLALSSAYYELENLELNSRISIENYQTATNKLMRNVISYIEIFESRLPGDNLTDKELPIKTVSLLFKTSIARMKVIEVLLANPNGLTIKEINEQANLSSRKFLIAALDELITAKVVERYKEKGRSLNRIFPTQIDLVKSWF